MPLSGSQKAYKQARSGIARAGATRSGYFTWNSVITINGVDRTSSILVSSLKISLALNDEPDTASFTLKPGATIPTAGQFVTVNLGAVGNPIFAGQVVRVVHRRRVMPGTQQAPFVDVQCIDWTALFDRLLICTSFSSQSATAIAQAIVYGYTSGFTSVNVQDGLPTIEYFPLTNEQPSAALRRLVNLMGGGGYYVDPNRDVHLFDVNGETGLTAPLTLTNTLGSLMSFTHTYDYSQVRNRIEAEGQRTTCPIAIDPATFPRPSLGSYADFAIPIETFDAFDNPAGSTPVEAAAVPGIARIGTQVISHAGVPITDVPGVSAHETNVTVDTAVGATSLQVDETAGHIGGSGVACWVRINEQIIFSDSNDVTPTRLTGIPASGPGSIGSAIKAGASVKYLPMLVGIPAGGAYALLLKQPKDADVVLRLELNDTASQTALAVIEGGDGVHMHVISDGRLSLEGLTTRAQSDLDAFKDPILNLMYDTDDMNALPGRPQVVNLTTTDALSDTLMITKVDLTFPVPNALPFRRCEASTVRLAQFADMTEIESI